MDTQEELEMLDNDFNIEREKIKHLQKSDLMQELTIYNILGIEDNAKRQLIEFEYMERARELHIITPFKKLYNAVCKQSADCNGDNRYTEINDRVYRNKADDGTTEIANFVIRPIEELTKDNGETTSKYFCLGGRMYDGKELKPIQVSAEEFPNVLKWTTTNWGARPTIYPPKSNYDHFGAYIRQLINYFGLPERVMYQHTGFREVDGKLIYLNNNSTAGGDNISCELETELKGYGFIESDILPLQAMHDTLKLLELGDTNVLYPLMSFIYLAPLNYFFNRIGYPVSFALFLKGMTGAFKTTTAALFLSHFTNGVITAPTSFRATANAIEKLAFTLKDMPLLVDDYHPTNAKEKASMDNIAQRLARGAGDHASRSRLDANSQLRKSYTPRGTTIITGEDMPNIGQSGVARFHVVNFEKGGIDSAKLTQAKDFTDSYNKTMQGYIMWLISIADTLENDLKNEFLKYRDELYQSKLHGRTASNTAYLRIGIVYFLKYAVFVGAISEQAAEEHKKTAFDVFDRAMKEQAELQKDTEPVQMFINALNELISSGQYGFHALNSDGGVSYNGVLPSDKILGYDETNGEYYYCYSDITCKAVTKFYDGQFPIGRTTLFKHLERAGVIATQNGQNTIRKNIDQKQSRFLALKRNAVFA